ncbi:MAG: TonB-dependent receptor [Bacteroidales bacterium]|jgi:outer membrane receptor for ferrienterochelin and colicin|nr:TonB-dependent receptor [Bacteroidales bacterium]
MKVKNIIKICLFSLVGTTIFGQNIQGTVYEYNTERKLEPLLGATLLWQGTTIGTVTNDSGQFSLPYIKDNNKLIVRYVGYQADTILVKKGDNDIRIIMTSSREIVGVTITAAEGTYISSKPILTQVITTEGLRRAACCNLSESFESTAAVDVSYSDAITGAKQIQMLGLAGVYNQLMLENTPYIRGLSIPFGLMFVPGSWMESINISKGTASVLNGYESISGQIDIQYKKPETNKEKLFLNLFFNSELKSELNLNTRFNVNESNSGMVLFHFENQPMKMDFNKDGFMDKPLSTQAHLMNRWDYDIEGKMEGRTMLSYLYDTRTGGQMDFNKNKDKLTSNHYGIGVDNHRLNIISKNGILLKGNNESIGTIASFTFHQFNAFYGLNQFNSRQLSGYANAYYENFLDKKNRHKIDAGASFQIDNYAEMFNDSAFNRMEIVPGIFTQYSFILDEKFIATVGIRADYNTYYGLFWTPRFHAKWEMGKGASARLTAGKGYRSANIFIENTALMTSNRQFVITEKLKAEEAWNAGVSFTQSFHIKGKENTLIVDYFYTRFVNQVITDIDQNVHSVYFYNLTGLSYSHSAQAELIINPFRGFEITAAYRFNFVQETVNGKLQEKPFMSRHKAILNLNYSTKFDKWKFNLTAQFHGKQRLPNTKTDPNAWQLAATSPAFFTFNAQITKKFRIVEIYLGVENFTNYTQKNPILDPQNPFGQYFDASMIWGPITGIMGYAGMRLILK